MRNEIQKIIDYSDKKQIDLGDLNIHDEEIKEILLAIKAKFPSLQTLFLNNNQLSDQGAKIIGNELQALDDLVFIDLQFNNLSADGASAIYSDMASHKNFKLALAGTQIIDAEEMYAIEKESNRAPGYK